MKQKNNNYLDVNYVLGKRIQYLRSLKKKSQEDLALDCGINKNYLSDLERGTRNPTLKILLKISKGLDVTLSDLFRGVDA